jgi:centractin
VRPPGLALTPGQWRSRVAGDAVTQELLRWLQREGHAAACGSALASSGSVETVRRMKEALCFVAAPSTLASAATAGSGAPSGAASGGSSAGGAAGVASKEGGEYALPDGHKVRLGSEVWRVSEVLFNPAGVTGEEELGVAAAAVASVLKVDPELRGALCGNVVLTGGTTAMRGFGERTLAELRRGLPADVRLKVWAPAQRKVLPWIGGSVLASLGTFPSLCVTKGEWDDVGPTLLARKGWA